MFERLDYNEGYKRARFLCLAWQFGNEMQQMKATSHWFSCPSALNIKKKSQATVIFITEK